MKSKSKKRKKTKSKVKLNPLELRKEIILFFKALTKKKKASALLIVSIIFLLLPGSNYYLNLTLVPQKPFIRPAPFELEKPALVPVSKPEKTRPYITAKAAIIIDANSGVTLFEKNPHQRLLPASTTKVMTALVALDHYPLNKIITVKQAHNSIGQTMDLLPGERMTVENLLYGLLMHSGNDAALALAENFEGGYQEFVMEMNRLASKYYLQNTQFKNVSGIDKVGHYTSVADLARLSAVAMKNKTFSDIVITKSKVVSDVDNTVSHVLTNRNELLGIIQGIRGTKTGWTEQAGECLVTNTIRDGNEIITVVLGSNDRFGESKQLIEWAFINHDWVPA